MTTRGLARRGRAAALFTAGDENRLERYELTGEPGSFGVGTAETVLDGLPAASYRNGGRMDELLAALAAHAGVERPRT